VMPLRRATLTQPIARVITGLSFENMTQAFPFEFSRYHADAQFQDPRIVELVGKADVSGFFARGSLVNRFYERLYRLLPVGRASRTFAYLRAKWNGTADAPLFRADGTDAYTRIEAQIAAGTYDFARHRDPQNYFTQEDVGEVRYLATGRLAPEAKALFSRTIALLRTERIPTVLYETGRTAAYERLIDQHPVLGALRAEWRVFFRRESHGCVRFLDADTLRPLYDDGDFFDAVHFIGSSQDRLAARLADELERLERACRSDSSGGRGSQ